MEQLMVGSSTSGGVQTLGAYAILRTRDLDEARTRV